jgi:biotin synthase
VEAGKLMGVDEVRAPRWRPKPLAPPAFAWVPPGARPRTVTLKSGRLIGAVKDEGLEACCHAGHAGRPGHAEILRDAGLDYYNHNLDTAPDFYGDVISTRDYQDRLDTLVRVRNAGISVCCGGIVGMGESRLQRAGLIAELANLAPYPESVPINHLVAWKARRWPTRPIWTRWTLCAPLPWPASPCPRRACACRPGASSMSDAVQALCFVAGANSIFTATSCSPPPTPAAMPTWSCWAPGPENRAALRPVARKAFWLGALAWCAGAAIVFIVVLALQHGRF